jgi:hypothetical protein
MTRYSLVITIAAALLASATAVAGDIYKWIDDDGSVHYEDRPVANVPMERLQLLTRNTDNAAVQARVAARRKARATALQVASEAPPDMSRQEIRAEQQKRQQKCQEYRDRLERFLRSRRLYKEGASGEREYLDEAATMAARNRVQGQIQEYCGSA